MGEQLWLWVLSRRQQLLPVGLLLFQFHFDFYFDFDLIEMFIVLSIQIQGIRGICMCVQWVNLAHLLVS